MKTFTLHGHLGPNPWKVALVLETLGLPYTNKIYDTPDLKKEPFNTQLNRNGFTPVLEDPNNDFKIWESNACMEYLIMAYDDKKNPILNFPPDEIEERSLVAQYMSFQASFQGPAMTNAFAMRSKGMEQASQYFVEQSIRILDVLQSELQGKTWLVGEKCTIADLGFLPFSWSLPFLLGDTTPDMQRDYPAVDAWTKRMMAEKSAQKVFAARLEAVKQNINGLA